MECYCRAQRKQHNGIVRHTYCCSLASSFLSQLKIGCPLGNFVLSGQYFLAGTVLNCAGMKAHASHCQCRGQFCDSTRLNGRPLTWQSNQSIKTTEIMFLRSRLLTWTEELWGFLMTGLLGQDIEGHKDWKMYRWLTRVLCCCQHLVFLANLDKEAKSTTSFL